MSKEIATTEDQSFEKIAKMAFSSGKYGAEYTVATMMNIFYTATELGISPMVALNGGFYIVKGKISMSTQLMASMIRKAGHSIKIPEWDSTKCSIIGVRKDNGDSVKITFTMEDAQRAGLSGKGMWLTYPQAMVYNRAMSMLARVLFSDVTGGCYDEDERKEIEGSYKDAGKITQGTIVTYVEPEIVQEESLEELVSKILEHFCDQDLEPCVLEYIDYITKNSKNKDKPIIVLRSILSRMDYFKSQFNEWVVKSAPVNKAV